MFIIALNVNRFIHARDDLEFRVKDVAFETNVFNMYGHFDQIANVIMEDLFYV